MKLRVHLPALVLRFGFSVGLTGLLLIHDSLPIDPLKVVGLFILSVLAGSVIHVQLERDHLPPTKKEPGERLVWLTTLLGLAGVQIVRKAVTGADPDALLMAAAPLCAQGLLIGGQVAPSLGATTVTLGCLLLGVSGVLSWPVLFVAWFLGVAGSWLITPLKRRSDLFRAVSVLLVIGILAGGVARYFASNDLASVLGSALWGGVACVTAASIFWFGATVLEKVVGLTSEWTLLELCSPDHPLIQDLCMKAPGTYAHSVMVGNLAETAARSIGASPVVCRALAIFHDVGKLSKPACYIENQRGSNIHDTLSPAYSAQLIISHVQEGLELARQHGLPPVVVDGIAQHHGTSLITPFLLKATGGGPIDETLESLFRYPGPKPQSKEAAILHLADSVEAASRLLRPNEDCAPMIAKLVAKSLADGQLAECDLTFRELHTIQDSFASTLSGMRHDRIAYPDALPAEPLRADNQPLHEEAAARAD